MLPLRLRDAVQQAAEQAGSETPSKRREAVNLELSTRGIERYDLELTIYYVHGPAKEL